MARRAVGIVTVVVLALMGGVGGFLLHDLTRSPGVQPPPGAAAGAAEQVVGTARPDFTLTDVDGARHAASDWDGQVVILNFWATWCPPCRREIPAFISLQEEYGARGLQIVGVAIDQQELVQPYIETMGVNYPVLVGELEAIDISRAYGNQFGQLPYTVFIDRAGVIQAVERGEVEREHAEALIEPLL